MTSIIQFCAITSLINFLTTFLLGILFLIKSYKIKVNRYFAYFCFTVAFWSFFYFIWLITPNDAVMAGYYLRTCMIGTFYIPSTFFHFTTMFLNRRTPKWLIIFNYAFSTVSMFFVYTPLYAHNIDKFIGFWWLTAGILFHLIILHFALVIFYSLWCLWNAYKHTKDEKFERQIKLVFIGLTIAFISGSMNYLMWYHIPVPPFSNFLVSVYVLMITYAILKYQLMDIKIVIRKSLIYSILVSLITIIFSISILVFEHLSQYYFGYKSILTSILSSFIIALLIIPLRNQIQYVIDRLFFKGTQFEIAQENLRLKEELTHTEKMKAVALIASGLAHEIKNPLTAIQTFTEYLPQKRNDNHFLDQYTHIVSQETKRINDLIQELLIFSKPSEPKFESVDPKILIENLIKLLSPQIAKANIKTNIILTNSPESIQADPSQLKQALLNIIMNAIDAMPNGGTLTVSTSVIASEAKQSQQKLPSSNNQNLSSPNASVGDLNHYIIEISDTGCGIAPKDLPHIFDPFFTKKEKGTGLGLAITQGIIEKHGGTITVKSKVNQGTSFIIKLSL